MKKLLHILIIILSITAYGQTNVSGGIFSNTTWTKANSPYIVTGDIAVYPGKTLTVEPGVIVKVNDDRRIIIRGALIARGTVNDSIQFISNSSTPAKSKWVGFQIENNLGGRAKVEYFKGSHAYILFKITANSTGEVLNISHSSIINNYYAIYGYESMTSFTVSLTNTLFYDHFRVYTHCKNLNIDSCIFKKGAEAIHGDSNFTVNNSEFSEFTSSPTRTGGTYTNCKFYHNTNGLYLFPQQHLINCEIFNNTNGIVLYYDTFPENFSISNTCLSNNTSYDIKHMYNYNIDLSGVSWTETDPSVIANKIYDAYDDINMGIVNFSASNNCTLSPMGITDNIKNPTAIKIFPNPFSTQTTLQSDIYLNNATLSLYNSFGQSVKQIKNISGYTVTLQRDDIPSSVYILHLNDNNEIYLSTKLIITDK
ncbi:T9SS type A sorting domain-containing protein [Flavobacterium sp. SM15]|uniref:T9SS type A sorting domain-containing protein n=1 Tax=Flavobacterium sp. SM15 TaxID=2908005 RepID=UPI001EDB7301|nr:T9SS type A sorting domain-containing protein [Flavobacterium sp. SM15]MCG2612342.1 T9SS type A sorting domain-containing protein [Flavobacterium sp. SM15]